MDGVAPKRKLTSAKVCFQIIPFFVTNGMESMEPKTEAIKHMNE